MSRFGWGPFLGLNARGPLTKGVENNSSMPDMYLSFLFLFSYTTAGDPCTSSPCVTGNCINLGDGQFKCSCTEGWYGSLCNTGKVIMFFLLYPLRLGGRFCPYKLDASTWQFRVPWFGLFRITYQYKNIYNIKINPFMNKRTSI